MKALKVDSMIFDLDGTLWDCTGIFARAWEEELNKQPDVDVRISADQLKQLFGKILEEIGAQLFPGKTPERINELLQICYAAEDLALEREEPSLYPETEKILQQLSARIPLFVVSNCQSGYIEKFYAKTGFGKYFTGKLCPGDSGEAKAENIRRIVADYGLQHPVYIGDTLGDYTATKDAGIPFVFAAYGYGQVPAPDAVISCPADLLALLS